MKVYKLIQDNFKLIIIEDINPPCDNRNENFLNFGKKTNNKEILQFEKIDEIEEISEFPSESEVNLSQ